MISDASGANPDETTEPTSPTLVPAGANGHADPAPDPPPAGDGEAARTSYSDSTEMLDDTRSTIAEGELVPPSGSADSQALSETSATIPPTTRATDPFPFPLLPPPVFPS